MIDDGDAARRRRRPAAPASGACHAGIDRVRRAASWSCSGERHADDRGLQRHRRRLQRHRRRRQLPQTGTTCICPGLDPAKVGVGTCKAGHPVCRGTRGFVLRRLRAARPRDLRRPRQRLRRRGRHDPDLPLGAADARRVAARSSACPASSPARTATSASADLLRAAALRGQQDLPDRPAAATRPPAPASTCAPAWSAAIAKVPRARPAASTATPSAARPARCATRGVCQTDKCQGVTCASQPVLRQPRPHARRSVCRRRQRREHHPKYEPALITAVSPLIATERPNSAPTACPVPTSALVATRFPANARRHRRRPHPIRYRHWIPARR